MYKNMLSKIVGTIIFMIILYGLYHYYHKQTVMSTDSQDVVIQLGYHHPKQDAVHDEDLDPVVFDDVASDIDKEQSDVCQPGDEECQRNLNFFNTTFFTGMLDLDDKVASNIDNRDKEFKQKRAHGLKVFSEASNSQA